MIRTTARRGWGLAIAAACALALFLAAQLAGLAILLLQPALIAAGAGLGVLLLRQAGGKAEGPVRPAWPAGGWIAGIVFVIVLTGLPWLAGLNPALSLADSVYRAGALVFGGGHVVLPLLQAELSPEPVNEAVFLSGYGLAQALPGPLFSFAAFLGASSADDPLLAVGLALLAAVMVFLPGLLLVFAVLPAWSSLKAHPLAQGGLSGAAAAATGILAYALYDPVLTSLPMDWAVWVLALAAAAALQLLKLPPPFVVAACALAGWLLF